MDALAFYGLEADGDAPAWRLPVTPVLAHADSREIVTVLAALGRRALPWPGTWARRPEVAPPEDRPPEDGALLATASRSSIVAPIDDPRELGARP